MVTWWQQAFKNTKHYFTLGVQLWPGQDLGRISTLQQNKRVKVYYINPSKKIVPRLNSYNCIIG